MLFYNILPAKSTNLLHILQKIFCGKTVFLCCQKMTKFGELLDVLVFFVLRNSTFFYPLA